MPPNDILLKEQQQLKSQKLYDDHCGSSSSSGVCTSSEDEEQHHIKVKKNPSTTNNKISNVTMINKPSDNKEEEIDIKERYQTLPIRECHEKFLRKIYDEVLNKAIFSGTERDNKVIEWNNPEELEKKFDMTLKDDADTDEMLLNLAQNTMKYSVKVGHPYFVNQLFSAVDPYGFAGQVITDALNPSVYTYEVSPVFILMEEITLKEMRKIVGFPNGDGDGIFCPGGSIANGYAISCARYYQFPDVKTKGLHSLPRLVLFTSADAHYSIKKLASFMGLGTDNVYLIRTTADGKMDSKHLESEILRAKSEGAKPFMVSATAGTTVLGAFDPLEQIADLCQKHKLWMHVDAAWGGGALMSQKYRKLLNGIQRADSVTWNPHKLLACPQQCSTFLCRHEGILSNCHSSNATYLFQKDKFYDTKYDTGDKHIQCGRRADVFKFWYMWRAKGTKGLAKHIDTLFEHAEYFTSVINKRDGFEMVLDTPPECTNICFWYIPSRLRNMTRDSNFTRDLHKVAPKIKEGMMREGTMMITYQPLGDKPNFFRLVLQSSALNKTDMMHFVTEIERLGEAL